MPFSADTAADWPERKPIERIGANLGVAITHSDPATQQKARLNLAAFALEQPDSHEWLADMLDALGLRGR